MNIFKVIMMAPIFVILLVVIFHTVSSAFGLGKIGSFFVSLCVSILAVIGMLHFLKGSIGVILLPYAALGIAIVLITLVSFFCRYLNKGKERACAQLDRKEGIKINDKNIRKQQL